MCILFDNDAAFKFELYIQGGLLSSIDMSLVYCYITICKFGLSLHIILDLAKVLHRWWCKYIAHNVFLDAIFLIPRTTCSTHSTSIYLQFSNSSNPVGYAGLVNIGGTRLKIELSVIKSHRTVHFISSPPLKRSSVGLPYIFREMPSQLN